MLGLVLAVTLCQVELPPEAQLPPPPPAPPLQSVPQRAILEGLGGIVGTGAALGISLAFTLSNPGLDAKFSNAALGSLLMAGAAFTVHEVLGGRGEITLVLLTSIIAMAGGALAASFIDQTVPAGAILCSAIAAVPGGALAALALEGTTPAVRPPLKLALTGNGFMVQF